MLRIALFLLVLCVSLDIWAAESQKGPATHNKSQKATQQQQGTEQQPLVVKLTNTGKSEQESANESNQISQQTQAVIETVHVTWVLAGLTFVLALIAGWQVLESRLSNQRQLRAYVSVSPEQITDDSGAVIPDRHGFAMKNVGQTPAHDFESWGAVEVSDYPLKKKLVEPTNERPTIRTVLSPDQKRYLIKDRVLSPEENEKIKAGHHALYAWGRINYKDAFGKKRWTTFCFFLDKDALRIKRWAWHGTGNEADQGRNKPPF